MELDDHAFLNELLSMRRESWDISFPAAAGDDESEACFDCFFHDPGQICPGDGDGRGGGFAALPGATFGNAVEPPGLSFSCFDPAGMCATPPIAFGGRFPGEVHSSCSPPGNETLFHLASAYNDDCSADLERNELCLLRGGTDTGSRGEDGPVFCKLEDPTNQNRATEGDSTAGSIPTRQLEAVKARAKKMDGQPSKNLMAERRRRKRLNDRLSMLRSVVPKISKMDRTSILGDTIEYMKELLDRIQILRVEMERTGDGSHEHPSVELLEMFRDRIPRDEALVRHTPKFNVERRETETRVEVYCAARSGLLLSTVNTLEALGLEIRQCVVSCFNDFGMHASCSEDAKQTEHDVTSTEEIKQALFRNAGYGGRCA